MNDEQFTQIMRRLDALEQNFCELNFRVDRLQIEIAHIIGDIRTILRSTDVLSNHVAKEIYVLNDRRR